ncbi:MAG: TPM domain-containing protein [Ignavibacteria bacterium]|nr:TPM domain-containing protein [Ignavibacteria bacterium]
MKFRFVNKILSKEDILEIENKIKEIEKNTSGEIRLCIKNKRNYLQRNMTSRAIALDEFYKLGMDKTKEGTGVLIFILLAERIFEIVGDYGINSKVSQEFWDSIAEQMSIEFKNKNFKKGIIYCLEEIGKKLQVEFPRKENDINELSDSVSIEN